MSTPLRVPRLVRKLVPGQQGPAGATGAIVAFNTRSVAAARNISGDYDFVSTAGYSSVGDLGGALYKRGSVLTIGGFQSADGAFWDLAEQNVNFVMFGAVGNGVADDTTAIQAAIDYQQLTQCGVDIPYGFIWRTTDTVGKVDATRPIRIIGAGQFAGGFYGDFLDPSKAIIDISFTSDAARIGGHKLDEISIWSNGVAGDPIGIKSLRGFQSSIRRVHIPGSGGAVILGARRKHAGVGLYLTNQWNVEVIETDVFSGYQPIAYDIGTTVRFSGSENGTTITATQAIFAPEHVGKLFVFSAGEEEAGNANYFWATIVSKTSDTVVEISRPLSQDVSGAKGSIGYVTGSMDAAGVTLTLDQPVLTSAHVGMRVHIPLAWVNPDAGNTKGLLCTYIVSVDSSTVATVAASADAAVSSVPIIFCPAIFLGTPAENINESGQTNDICFQQCQIEGTQGANLIINKGTDILFDNFKLHGKSPSSDPGRFTRSMFRAIVSGVGHMDMRATQWAYNYHPTYGQMWVMGSRGTIVLDGIETQGLLYGAPGVYIDDEIGDDFRLLWGPVKITDGLDKQPGSWSFVRTSDGKGKRAVQVGPLVDSLGERNSGINRFHPGYADGRWYFDGDIPATPSAAQTADLIYIRPLVIYSPVSVQALGVRISTGVASSAVKVGIYTNRQNFHAGRLAVVGDAEIDTSGTGGVSATVTPIITLGAGVYWRACLVKGAPLLRSIATTDYGIAALIGGVSIDHAIANSGQDLGFTIPGDYAAGLPDDLTGAVYSAVITATVPVMGFQAKSL